MDVTMFQMGFGESILIHEGDSCLLVDCGSESKHSNEYFDDVVKELEKYTKRSLLISHFHEDHMNGVKYLYDHCTQGFDMVYLPNIFEKGNKALEILIVQYLKDLGTKKSESYQLWQLLLNLIKAKNQVQLIQRGDDFVGSACQFRALWPVNDNKKVVALWNQIEASANNIGFSLQQISEAADWLRETMRWITEDGDVAVKYSRAEEAVSASFENFLNLRTRYIELISRKDEDAKRKTTQLQALFKKLKDNEHSIVFHTVEEHQLQVLMTGDATKESMLDIANNSVLPYISIKENYHVLKAHHHGTATHYCDFLSCDRLLISNGETPKSSRGPIAEQYLLNGRAKHVYCTNTIRSRCEYMKKHNQCADVCVDCKAGGIRVDCVVSQISEESEVKVGWIANKALRDILEAITDIALVHALTTKEYGKCHFNLSYSVLVAERTDDNKKRYYARPLKIMGTQYYLCKEWRERNRLPLLKWIDEFTKIQKGE